MKQIQFRVPDEMHKDFKSKAAKEGISMSDLIKKWIKEYLYGKKESK